MSNAATQEITMSTYDVWSLDTTSLDTYGNPAPGRLEATVQADSPEEACREAAEEIGGEAPEMVAYERPTDVDYRDYAIQIGGAGYTSADVDEDLLSAHLSRPVSPEMVDAVRAAMGPLTEDARDGLEATPSRELFVAQFATESQALEFEQYVLSAGREFLSPAEIAVLDGAEPTPQYWAAMLDALEKSDALDQCGYDVETK